MCPQGIVPANERTNGCNTHQEVGGEGKVLIDSFARRSCHTDCDPLTARPPDDGTLFLSERFSMIDCPFPTFLPHVANKCFFLYPIYLNPRVFKPISITQNPCSVLLVISREKWGVGDNFILMHHTPKGVKLPTCCSTCTQYEKVGQRAGR